MRVPHHARCRASILPRTRPGRRRPRDLDGDWTRSHLSRSLERSAGRDHRDRRGRNHRARTAARRGDPGARLGIDRVEPAASTANPGSPCTCSRRFPRRRWTQPLRRSPRRAWRRFDPSSPTARCRAPTLRESSTVSSAGGSSPGRPRSWPAGPRRRRRALDPPAARRPWALPPAHGIRVRDPCRMPRRSRAASAGAPADVGLVIGPEGGFDVSDLRVLLDDVRSDRVPSRLAHAAEPPCRCGGHVAAPRRRPATSMRRRRHRHDRLDRPARCGSRSPCSAAR